MGGKMLRCAVVTPNFSALHHLPPHILYSMVTAHSLALLDA